MIISLKDITSNMYKNAALILFGIILIAYSFLLRNANQEAKHQADLYTASRARLQVERNKAGQYESKIQAFEGRVKDVMKLNADQEEMIGRLQDALKKRPKAEAAVVFKTVYEHKASGKTDSVVYVATANTPIYKGVIDQHPIKAKFRASPDSLVLDPLELTFDYEVAIEYKNRVPFAIVTPLTPNTKALEVRSFVKGKPKKSLLPIGAAAFAGFLIGISLAK
jgi:hypothetical protein